MSCFSILWLAKTMKSFFILTRTFAGWLRDYGAAGLFYQTVIIDYTDIYRDYPFVFFDYSVCPRGTCGAGDHADERDWKR